MRQFVGQERESQRQMRPLARARSQESGYVLLTLLLAVSLMIIAAAAVLPSISFVLRRDREQEMIHRGVQYTRAIRTYYKKFGRYPTRLEDLESTNNLRFLRKRYKDPLNKNQDFRLLHFGEQGVTLAGGIPGASPVGSPLNSPGANNSPLGGPAFGNSGPGNSGVNSSGVFAQNPGFGGNPNSGFGANSNTQTPPGQPGTNASSDTSQAASQVVQGPSDKSGAPDKDTSSSSQQVVGGGPIVGVASLSKKDTIRVFNKKRKYNEWQFIYDPATDRGGLITTPNQPALQGFANQQNLQPGGNNTNNSPFGQSSSFGNSANPNGPSNPPQPPMNSAPPQ